MPYEFKLPDIGEGVVEGEIVRWLVREGDQLREDQPMLEVMTDKATVELSSPVQGKVLTRHGEEGETVEVGSTLVVIEMDEATEASHRERARGREGARVRGREGAGASKGYRQQARGSEEVLATPAVRKLARDLGIDLAKVGGTRPGGRITREDVEFYATTGQSKLAEAEAAAEAPQASETIPYRGLRRKIGDHMRTSKSSAVHYTYIEEVDVTELVRLRRQFLALSGGDDVRLTYIPFIIKAVIEGLKKYPLVNSSLDEEQGVIHIKKYYNIGIATATEEGLIVPVVKQADRKNVLELAREVAELSEKTRRGDVQLDDLKDSTFTITSLGSLGGVLATPIINFPEVAILGIHKIAQKPVVRHGQIVVAEMMNLSLTLDHRVVDGAIGAQFLHHVIPYIESPGLLLLQAGS
ncbi:MAG: dihydrolipoamide acetyltransferase family protein [Acidobacteriota bacterium]